MKKRTLVFNPQVLTLLSAITIVCWSFHVSAQETGQRVSANIGSFPFHGYLSVHYTGRETEDFSDHDLYQYLSLDVGQHGVTPVSGHLFARGSYDMDGDVNVYGYNVYDDTQDVHGEDYYYRVYSAYLDFSGSLGFVRLGRQQMYETPFFAYFDGGRVESAEAKQFLNLKVGAYGGIPIHHLWESTTRGDESIYGAYLQSRPWPGARVQIHWAHIEDENYYGNLSDDFYSAGFWQSFLHLFQIHGYYSMFNDKPRDLRGRATLFIPETETLIQVAYYELLENHNESVVEFDYYYVVMGAQLPYSQTSFVLHQGLGPYFAIDGGGDLRRLTQEEEDLDQDIAYYSFFNHEYDHYFLTFSVLPLEGLVFSVTGDRWTTENQADEDDNSFEITTAAADVTYRAPRKFRASAGTYYALYDYNIFLGEEQTEVRVYYGKVRWHITQNFRLDLGYEYEEDDDDRDFQTYKAGLNLIF